ncbi:hypothetical protein EYF80_025152 [Liparis tanakae]|uniref:Uncharacterized protein n=1 Tax=Liparis tanakae TaxID=230148 RepID=A0A4Z2HI76_9TELE|nr:hypothetical protein EYF80_025152 [Liparis tanakae]
MSVKLSDEVEPRLDVVAREPRLDVREPRLLPDEQDRPLRLQEQETRHKEGLSSGRVRPERYIRGGGGGCLLLCPKRERERATERERELQNERERYRTE